MLTGPEKTRDGFDLQFGTNHLGHYLLTDILMTKLLKSADEGREPRFSCPFNSAKSQHKFPYNFFKQDCQRLEQGSSVVQGPQMVEIIKFHKIKTDFLIFFLQSGAISTSSFMGHLTVEW